jgi:predicted small secreted protein
MKLHRMQAVFAIFLAVSLLLTGCAAVENFLCSNRVTI